MSNWVSDPGVYGNIEELESPSIADAGEPGTTSAKYDTFTWTTTVGSSDYLAQPGLAVEVSADNGSGGRAGGSVVLRQPTDHRLQLSNYFVKPSATGADDGDWTNVTATVPFTKPVTIKYVGQYRAGKTDIVKVYVNGKLTLTGGSYEGYYRALSAAPSTVNNILFRASRSVPVPGGSWDVVAPTADQLTALQGHGFYFTNLSYSVKATKKYLTGASTPTVSGTAAVGRTLTASLPTLPKATSHTYQWYRDGVPITGAIAHKRTLTAADDGKSVTVVVKAKKVGYNTLTATSVAAATVLNGTLRVGKASITGKAQVGRVLVAHPGVWTVATHFHYEWMVDGELAQQGKSPTFTLTSDEQGGVVSLQITGSKPGYDTATSAAVNAHGTVTPKNLL